MKLKCLRVVNTLCESGRRESIVFNFAGIYDGLIRRSLSTASSSILSKSSDVELSYSSYPTNKEEMDDKQTPLIFLHGLFGSKGNLHSVSKHLSSSGRKVVTFDARNHGNSTHSDQMDFPTMAQDLSDLIGQLAMKQPTVIGHSMGGKTAMTYALQHPESLSSLVVADVSPQASPGISDILGYAEAMKKVEIPQKIGMVQARKHVEVQLAPFIPKPILSFLLTNLVETEEGQIHWRMSLDAFIANHQAIKGFPQLDLSQPFTKPTLFIFGSESIHFKKADQGQIRSYFPSAQIEAIPNAGHFVHADKPLEFVKIVQEFLNSSKVV